MRTVAIAMAALVSIAIPLGAQERLVNGGFETGTPAGWSIQRKSGSNGDLTITTATTGPRSGLPQIGERTGSFYALTDMGGPGAYSLFQTFLIESTPANAIFSFAMSITNRASTVVGTNFEYTGFGPNQYVSVDLFTGALADGFSTATPLRNFFKGSTPVGPGGGPNPYVLYSFDVTSLLSGPGTYTIRFAEVDNQGFHNLAIDDVSLFVTTAAVPEPATIVLMATGLVGIGIVARRRRTRSGWST